MIANLKLIDSKILKSKHPVIANLLCYIAVETLCNYLAYFRKTKGIKYTDFLENYEIERKIKKSKEFQNFLNKYCPSSYKNMIKFQKRINNCPTRSTFVDVLQYLYQRNRCIIVHKGLFRNIEENTTSIDTFIDRNKRKCQVSISIPGNCLTEWFYMVVRESFVQFLLKKNNG